MVPQLVKKQVERRTKTRFPIQRELRYKILDKDVVVATGTGQTIDMASQGIAFQADQQLRIGDFIEVSVSWPALLDNTCAMRLVILGRVVRTAGRRSACRVDKYEFRTQSRAVQPIQTVRTDDTMRRWHPNARPKTATASGF